MLRLISREIILRSMRGAASWLENSVDSASGQGVGHRIALYAESGEVTWLYPHGNTGEVITAWRVLGKALDRPEYFSSAIRYADGLIEDREQGIYRGSFRSAHGLMWYWTDIGSYNSLYAMRCIGPLLQLHKVTGDRRFLETPLMMGATFLQRQTASGLVDASWSPARGWAEGGTRVGCRFLYCLATFASLFGATGDRVYRDAYEKSVGALLKMQKADGSFYQHYEVATAEPSPSDSSTKFLFFSYLLNALAEAYAVFEEERLLEAACRLGDFLVRSFYHRAALPYCRGEKLLPTDRAEAETGIFDAANGLLWLSSETGEFSYLDVATKLWLAAWSNQPEGTGIQGLDGAILGGNSPFHSATVEGVTGDRPHLFHDPARASKCTLWGMVNHIFASHWLLQRMECP